MLNSSCGWFRTYNILGQMTFVAQKMFHRHRRRWPTASPAEPLWLFAGSAAWLAYRALSEQQKVYYYPDVRLNMTARAITTQRRWRKWRRCWATRQSVKTGAMPYWLRNCLPRGLGRTRWYGTI